jgi:hypothetical protein
MVGNERIWSEIIVLHTQQAAEKTVIIASQFMDWALEQMKIEAGRKHNQNPSS